VFVGLVNKKADQEMKSLYTFQGAYFDVYHVFVALTENDSGNLFIKN
jgi:hypothetical protein